MGALQKPRLHYFSEFFSSLLRRSYAQRRITINEKVSLMAVN